MGKLNRVILLLAIALASLYGQSNAELQKTGEAWLGLIDGQKYAESWTEASSMFRGQLAQQRWVDMVKGVRGPLGAVTSRKVQTVTAAKSLPGAPDGEYTVIQFQTSFQHKATAVETLTLMKDAGKWRSAGYYIR